MAATLVAKAYQLGSLDNITIIIVALKRSRSTTGMNSDSPPMSQCSMDTTDYKLDTSLSMYQSKIGAKAKLKTSPTPVNKNPSRQSPPARRTRTRSPASHEPSHRSPGAHQSPVVQHHSFSNARRASSVQAPTPHSGSNRGPRSAEPLARSSHSSTGPKPRQSVRHSAPQIYGLSSATSQPNLQTIQPVAPSKPLHRRSHSSSSSVRSVRTHLPTNVNLTQDASRNATKAIRVDKQSQEIRKRASVPLLPLLDVPEPESPMSSAIQTPRGHEESIFDTLASMHSLLHEMEGNPALNGAVFSRVLEASGELYQNDSELCDRGEADFLPDFLHDEVDVVETSTTCMPSAYPPNGIAPRDSAGALKAAFGSADARCDLNCCFACACHVDP